MYWCETQKFALNLGDQNVKDSWGICIELDIEG